METESSMEKEGRRTKGREGGKKTRKKGGRSVDIMGGGGGRQAAAEGLRTGVTGRLGQSGRGGFTLLLHGPRRLSCLLLASLLH